MKIHNLYGKTLKVYFHEDYFHTYTLTEKKTDRLLSVTGVTGVLDKPALVWWSSNCAVDYIWKNLTEADRDKNYLTVPIDKLEEARNAYRNVSKTSADIGTAIHKWIEEWIQCKGVGIDMPDDEKVLNGITAFLKFQNERNFKWIESERIVYSKKHKFVGTLDAVAKVGKDLVLVDFKSSKRNKNSKDGLYDEMKIQVCGYAIAWEEEMGKKFDRYMVLKFDKETGEFEATELDRIKEGKRAFLNCLGLKNYLKELSKK